MAGFFLVKSQVYKSLLANRPLTVVGTSIYTKSGLTHHPQPAPLPVPIRTGTGKGDFRTFKMRLATKLIKDSEGFSNIFIYDGGPKSGVSIGYGNDLGQSSKDEIVKTHHLLGLEEKYRDSMLAYSGVKGAAAKEKLADSKARRLLLSRIVITEDQAERALNYKLLDYERVLGRTVKLKQTVKNSIIWEVLLSAAWNLGPNSSLFGKVGIAIENDDYEKAAEIIQGWHKPDALPGLIIRRKKEANLIQEIGKFKGV